MEHICDILSSYMTIGDVTRLCMTSKQCYEYRKPTTTLHASLKTQNINLKPTYTWKMFIQSNRCKECGTVRSITKYKRNNLCTMCMRSLDDGCSCPGLKIKDYCICMTCARDPTNYRFLLKRNETYEFAVKHRRGLWMLKKSAFLRKLSMIRPKMITKKKEYLYSPKDVIQIATCELK